jgi:hypothetical protein
MAEAVLSMRSLPRIENKGWIEDGVREMAEGKLRGRAKQEEVEGTMNPNNVTCYGILARALEWWEGYELRRVARKIPGAYDLVVQNGPFRGLRFSSTVDAAKNLPKIIGSYEIELHETIEKLVILGGFRLLLNVGAAEGYYAVGMAMRMPACKVVAFEMDDALADRCRHAAILNSVDKRLQVVGKCDGSSLAAFDLEDALIIMDCEGAEVDILSANLLAKLSRTWIMVELHDALRPGVSRTLWQRFHNSHSMQFIEAISRNQDISGINLRQLGVRERMLAVHENRLGIQEWVVMTPKKCNT